MPLVTPAEKAPYRTLGGRRLLGAEDNKFCAGKWWVVRGSNPRPTRCKRVALPAELTTQVDLPYAGKANADPYKGPALKKIAKN